MRNDHTAEGLSPDALDRFYAAYAAHDADALADLLCDDVVWMIGGPVDLLPFCGTTRGKRAVLDLIQNGVTRTLRVTGLHRERTLIDGDGAAMLCRLSGRLACGRTISYRTAHFMRFRDGRIAENLSVIDSFDAAEQVLGHALATPPDAPPLADGEDEIVAV